MNIIINESFGGFCLSDIACDMLHCSPYDFSDYTDKEARTNPELIGCVTLLGKEANGRHADIKVASIPDTATDWEIEEYDGFETITYVVNGKLRHDYETF